MAFPHPLNTKLALPSYLVTVLCVLGSACAPWKNTPHFETNDQLSESIRQESKTRVLLDVEFINASSAFLDDSTFGSLWQHVDETFIDSKDRANFLSNGIRVGKIHSLDRFLQALENGVTETNVVDDFLNEASVASDVSHGTQTLPLRLGKRSEFPLRQPFEGSHVALIRENGSTVGKTVDNAQYFLGLTATESNSAKRIRLALEPTIQHGTARQKWVSSESAIRIDTRRDNWDLEMLNLTVELSEGDTIILAPDRPYRGIASKMLSGKAEDQSERELLVLLQVTNIPLPSDQIPGGP